MYLRKMQHNAQNKSVYKMNVQGSHKIGYKADEAFHLVCVRNS